MIKFGCFANADPDKPHKFDVPVWRRSTLSAALGLSERLFVEFCILVGCDATDSDELHHHHADYRAALPLLPVHGVDASPFALEEGLNGGFQAFVTLLGRIRMYGSDFVLCAAPGKEKLQRAIDYSRAFYDLDQRLANTLKDGLCLVNADFEAALDAVEAAEVINRTVTVPAELEAEFRSWLVAHPPVQFQDCAEKVLEYFELLHTDTTLVPASPASAPLPLPLLPEHITALRQMLVQVRDPLHVHSPISRWTTVIAGKVYQDLLYGAVKQYYPFGDISNKVNK